MVAQLLLIIVMSTKVYFYNILCCFLVLYSKIKWSSLNSWYNLDEDKPMQPS